MALNVQTFKTRALTALVFVVIMLAGLFWNHFSFLALFSIIHFGCWYEYQKLMGNIYPLYNQVSVFHKMGVAIAGFGLMLLMSSGRLQVFTIPINEWGWWMVLVCAIVIPVSDILFSKNITLQALLISLAGLLYISFSWGCMMQLRANGFMQTGWILPVVLIASIWINDTMAYLVGSFIGKTPFSPISPKKTWEGTIGGAILCVATVTLAGYFALGLKYYWSLLIISAIAAVAGTLGDLLESKLKRMAGVKDSGTFMPGHGGFLDRFDSLLVTTPLVWLYLLLIN